MTSQNIDKIKFLSSGDGGLVVDFSRIESGVAIVRARLLGQVIRQNSSAFPGVRDAIPGLSNLLIQYNPLETSAAELKRAVNAMLPSLDGDDMASSRHWVVPVCYGGDYGPDLDEVAKAKGISADEVITRHAANTLTVAIMGFLPGLGYLKGVDPSLALPRKSTPRQHVPALSVGIAMDQTVIYPLASPGGWNLLGRTPVKLFDPGRDEPVLFRPGDAVSFTPVEAAEFKTLEAAVAAGESIISPLPSGGRS
ncbi:MAG: 5-oxoprolinase subunit PxpB [Alphaproteobacteria bacterium]|nr:5-oxoprolinase subunit PxpB [Alphaproteobacteria bacterium]